MFGVELLDQRIGVEPDGTGEHADVAACVDVAAAAGEVVLLDRVHDGDAHPGGAADFFDRQTCGDTSLVKHATDRRPVVFGELPMDTGAPFEREPPAGRSV